MAEKTSRSAGWKFQPSKKGNGLIQYTGRTFDSLDTETLNQLTDQVQELEPDDLSTFLSVIPSVEQLVQQIPYSLPLLEAIYLKCELLNVEEGYVFPLRELHCERLFCQLVWWIAYCEQHNNNPVINTKVPMYKDLKSCVSSIINVMNRQCAGLIGRAQTDKQQLSLCLESLGCHGLVNCSSGLIRMGDAVHLEILRHADRIKSFAMKVKESTDTKHVDPSIASHQRQMNLRLSEIFERLKHNESMESVLEDAINNSQLSSLLRIVRKRVASDRLLIGLFNAFTRAAPDDYSFEQLDPVIAKLILVFNNAYEKLLLLCAITDVDSGCSGGSSEGRRSSTETSAISPYDRESPISSTPSKSSSAINEAIATPNLKASHKLRRRFKRTSHCKSLNDLSASMNQSSIKPASSLGEILAPCTADVNSEKYETHEGRKTNSPDKMDRLLPEPDYPEASSYYNCATKEDVAALIYRFNEQFKKSKLEVMPALDQLEEFKDLEELQQKTILSIIVLTYRSVFESVHRRRERVWETIEEGDRDENEDTSALDSALYRHMHRRAKSQHGIQNSKEVTSQIWQTLYDFPSLKTCNIFNRFIFDCVDLSWDLVAGIDGKLPRMRIEYEGATFNEQRHTRTLSSDNQEDTIKAYLWPALFDVTTEKCLHKAIVITL